MKPDSDIPVLATIELPPPLDDNPVTLFEALWERRTTREIDARSLSLQQVSNLLWAAWGINRDSGPFGLAGRTAASASNSQEIELFVALQHGIYHYQALGHQLVVAAAVDARRSALTPHQRGIDAAAPIQLIYVADLRRLAHTAGYQEPGLQNPEIQKSYYYVDTGLIAANVYLYAAARGLAAWFHNCDKEALAELLDLGPEQRVLFAQSVGYMRPG